MAMSMETVRRFGVELEGFTEKDIYGNKEVDGHIWDIDSDGSLNPRDCDCDEDDDCDHSSDGIGIEARSEPLSNTGALYSMYNYLDSNGWKVNNSAGLHIHVEVADYIANDFKKLLALMVGIEPVIYSVTDSFRYFDSEYCGSLKKRSSGVSNVLNSEVFSYHGEWFFTDERYTGLNFRSYNSRRNTVEFRYFAPQTEAKKVEAYVELVTQIVDFAKFASLEQILVITQKLLSSTFVEAMIVIKEVLGLTCKLNKENNVFETYNSTSPYFKNLINSLYQQKVATSLAV
jgi:hypothetical protein